MRDAAGQRDGVDAAPSSPGHVHGSAERPPSALVPRPRTGATDDAGPLVGTLESLRRHGWVALHAVPWPGRSIGTITLVAIGPGGVVVLDRQEWAGEVALQDGILRQDGRRRDLELEAASSAAAQVTALLPAPHRRTARAVLCLAGHQQTPTTARGGVLVVGDDQVGGMLADLPERLSPTDVADVVAHLRGALLPGRPAEPELLRAVRGGVDGAGHHVGDDGVRHDGGRSGAAPERHGRRRRLLGPADWCAVGGVAVLGFLPEIGALGSAVSAAVRAFLG